MNVVEQAVTNGKNGYSCSEAVFSAFSERFGFQNECALKLSSGLAGGMGIEGGTCGVVTAGILVLGLAFGPGKAGDAAGMQEFRERKYQFLDRFEERHGAFSCDELSRGMNVRTREGALAIRKSGIPEQLIASCVEIVQEML